MSSMSLKSSRLAGTYYRFLEWAFVPPIRRFSLGPNAITFLGFVVALLVPAAFLLHALLGFVLILLSGMIDTIDGMASRTMGTSSLFGAFWDSTLDRFSDSFFLLGFWTILWTTGDLLVLGGLLFCLAGLLTLLISYTKARMEGLKITCPVGLMGREVRILYLLFWALLLGIFPAARTGVLWWGLGIYLALVGFTVVQRMLHAWRHLDPGQEGDRPT
jgi:CDP-diacylglycerol---glycerol-3-phosphate 3-phosphatidyltransferase